MDSNSSDQSPQSENTGGSWLQCWENEISSLSGLNLGSDSELNSLVEDKEIAARAVAFVVNSTRKGIVPLCADVANLLRSKRSLEKKVFMLKRENEVLRSSASLSMRTSHSTSPTPASLSSEKGSFTEHTYQQLEKGRPCSRCSQTSSTVSSSPRFEKCNRQRLSSLQNSPASSTESKGRRHSSPRFRRSRSCNRTQGGITTQAIIHYPPREVTMEPPDDKIVSVPELEIQKKIERKNSLPEIVCEPDDSVQKVSPRKSSIIEIQSSPSDLTKDDQFMETVRLNSRLAEDLGAAKKEIEVLKCRLRQLEGKQGHCGQDFYIENECDQAGLQYLEDRVLWLNNNNSHNSKQSRCPGSHSQRSHIGKKVQPISPLYSEPLHGCKCSACEETFSCDKNTVDTLSEGHMKFSVSHKLQVQMNDHVVCKGDRMGIIRYIGHLDRHGQTNLLYVGLELDTPAGKHDGCLNGKRYFYCSRDHGVFLPIQEIICKVGKKATRKLHLCENADKGSRRKASLEITKVDDTDRDNVFS